MSKAGIQVTVKCIKTNYTYRSRNPPFDDDDDEGEETFVNQKGLLIALKPSKKLIRAIYERKIKTRLT